MKFKPDNFILHIVLIMRVIICKRALNIGDRQGVVGGNGDNCTWTTIINKQINK